MKKDNDEAYDKFLIWLAQNDFYISSKIQITKNAVAGRGIVSSQTISPPEVLASFDKSFVLSPKNSYFSPLLSTLCYDAGVSGKTKTHSYATQSDHLANVRLTLALLLEKSLGENSFWKPYLDTLDEVVIPDSILLWDDDRNRLKGTTVYENSNNVLKIYYDQYKELVLPFFKKFKSLPISCPSWLKYLQTCILTQSRCFYIDDYHQLSLVPFVDIFNHQSNPEVAFLQCSNFTGDSPGDDEPTDYSRCNFLLNAVIQQGYEIFNCFGSFCADELLIQYGFLDPTCEIWQVDLERTLRSLFKEPFRQWKQYFDLKSLHDSHDEYCKLILRESSNSSRNILSRHHKSLCIFKKYGPSFATFSFVCFLVYNSYMKSRTITTSHFPFSKFERSLWNLHIRNMSAKEPKLEQELIALYADVLKTLHSIYEIRKSQYGNGGLSASDYKFLLDNSSFEHESHSFIAIKVFHNELSVLESELQRCIEIQSNLLKAIKEN
ncbi:lysine methyltransferase [Schizosaccharomyces octosporus yFS286]|uniref:Lysine methyltransferase n=1 Tax=Schizosaccharomyces octosporus (strain yFS286) TaxID=483514 RepID=S9R3F8_SCHOY|nr:lysine methyltransferase [Schizosaccharomyces octosporus yFS286]EPX72915.1 lysine methyltransferase [Schizosaccharomyces octosporus yFS286]